MRKIMLSLKMSVALLMASAMIAVVLPVAANAEVVKKPATKAGKSSGATETEYPSWFHDGFLDLKEDVAAASRSGKRLMVIFTQNGCPYCNALVERNLAQKDVEELVRGKFDVVTINLVGDRSVTHVDGKHYTEKTFAETLKVQFTPTILFFSEKGEIILRLNGYLPPDQFKIALTYIVEKNQLSYRDYIELNAPPPQAGKMNKESFFLLPPYNLTRDPAKQARPIAIFFEQKDCPNCDTLHQKVLIDRDTRKLIAKFDALQLDMWDKTPLTTPDGQLTNAREWAKKLDIKYAPTIVLFDGQGKEIIRSEAFFKLFHTQTLFDYVLSGGYKTQPSFQRYIASRSEHMREQGKDVDIWGMADKAPENSAK